MASLLRVLQDFSITESNLMDTLEENSCRYHAEFSSSTADYLMWKQHMN